MPKRQHSSTVTYSTEAPPKAALLSSFYNGPLSPANNLQQNQMTSRASSNSQSGSLSSSSSKSSSSSSSSSSDSSSSSSSSYSGSGSQTAHQTTSSTNSNHPNNQMISRAISNSQLGSLPRLYGGSGSQTAHQTISSINSNYQSSHHPNSNYMSLSRSSEQEEETEPQITIASHFMKEEEYAIHSSYLRGLTKEEFTTGHANLDVDNVDKPDLNCNVEQDDERKVWHAETIGSGGFGTVLKVTKRNLLTKELEETRAIKIIPNQTMGVSEAIKGARLNNNSNVVQVINVLKIRNICCLEMEYIEDGNLTSIIKSGFHISSHCLHKILMQCCEVMLLMKAYKMVHSDIKPDNIMVKNLKFDDFDIAIGDFGLSLLFDSLGEKKHCGGTPSYFAPELQQKFIPTFASDIFALGKSLQQLKSDDMFWKPYINGFTATEPKDRLNSFYALGIFECLLNKHMNPIWTNDLDFLSRMLELCGKSAHSFHLKYGFPLQLTKAQRKNEQFLLEYNLFDYADESLKQDEEFVMKSISKCEHVFNSIDESRKDYDFLLNAVSRNGKVLEFFDESSKKNKIIVLKAITQCAASFKFADETLKRDRDFVLECIKNNSNVFEFVYSEFKRDFRIAYETLKLNPKLLKFIDPSIQGTEDRFYPETMTDYNYGDLIIFGLNDEDNFPIFQSKFGNNFYYAKKGVAKQPKLLGLIDITLITSIEFIYYSVLQNEKVITYAHEQFTTNRELALLMIDNERVFQYLPEDFKSDKDFILEAVKRNGNIFKYVNEQFKDDYEIVLEAVKSGFNFTDIDKKFHQDKELVLEVVKQGFPLSSVHNSLNNDREIIKESLKYPQSKFDEKWYADKEMILAYLEGKRYQKLYDNLIFSKIDASLKSDRDIIVLASLGNYLSYDPKLQQDREFILGLAKSKSIYLTSRQYFEKIDDKELALEIVNTNVNCYDYLNEKFKQDLDIALTVVKLDGSLLPSMKNWAEEIYEESIKQCGFFSSPFYNSRHLPYPYKFTSDRDMVLSAVKIHGLSLEHTPLFASDKEIVWEAVDQNGMALEFADPKFRKKRKYVKAAVASCRDALKFVDEIFKSDNEILTGLPQQFITRKGDILKLSFE